MMTLVVKTQLPMVYGQPLASLYSPNFRRLGLRALMMFKNDAFIVANKVLKWHRMYSEGQRHIGHLILFVVGLTISSDYK
jgi:hypothetical protein